MNVTWKTKPWKLWHKMVPAALKLQSTWHQFVGRGIRKQSCQLFSEIRDLFFAQAAVTVTPATWNNWNFTWSHALLATDPVHWWQEYNYVYWRAGVGTSAWFGSKLITVEFSYGKDFDVLIGELKQYLPRIDKFKGWSVQCRLVQLLDAPVES